MRQRTWAFILLGFAVLLAACGGPSAAGPTTAPTDVPAARPTAAATANPAAPAGADLGTQAWKWTQAVTGAGTTMSVPDSSKFRIAFEPAAGRVGIATACQSATATYTTDGHALSIKLESMTNAVCPGDQLSGQFITQLGSVQSYSLDQGNLVLKLAGGGTLLLTH